MPLLATDRALLDAFRRGETAALTRVYRHYEPGVTALLRRGFCAPGGALVLRPGRGAELEDLVQRVFVRAFKHDTRIAYDGLRPYGGFLAGITKNVVLDALRRRYRETPADLRSDDLESFPDPDPAIPAEERLMSEEARALVRRFLERECDPRDQRLFALRYEQDRTQELTAESAGLTRIQVRRWETKFRGRLLRFLKRERYV